jgi:hypothetical protein
VINTNNLTLSRREGGGEGPGRHEKCQAHEKQHVPPRNSFIFYCMCRAEKKHFVFHINNFLGHVQQNKCLILSVKVSAERGERRGRYC